MAATETWVDRADGARLEDVVDAFDSIAAALSAEIDIDGLLRLIAERVCSVIGVSRCALYLRDSDRGLFRGKVVHPVSRADAQAWIRRSIAGIEADRFTLEILATKEPVLIVNTLQDPRPMRRAMLEWDIRTMLGVPMILRDEVVGLLFLDNEDVPHEFTPAAQRLAVTLANLSAAAISQARRAVEMRQTLRTVVRQNRLLRQVSAMEDQLSEQLLNGASLDEIAGSIFEMTDHPCGVYDSAFQPLAVGLPATDEPLEPRVMDLASRGLPEVTAPLGSLKPGSSTVLGPFPQIGVHHRYLVVRVHGPVETAGYVVLMDNRRRLTTFDAMVARRAAMMVALELSAERRAFDADRRARESLVRDLLHGLDEEQSLRRRASFHQLPLDEQRVVCLFARRGTADGQAPTVADVRGACSRAGVADKTFCASDETGVALLLPVDESLPATQRLAGVKELLDRVLAEFDPQSQAIVAISTVCRGVVDYPRALVDSREILRCMTSLLVDEQIRVLSCDDLGAGRLLLGSATPESAERFAFDVAGVLLEDTADRRQLLATLVAFCEANRNVRATGALLRIHENTVRYRIGKIADLTGLDVAANADDQLTAQLALLVFKLRGLLKRSLTTDAAPEVRNADVNEPYELEQLHPPGETAG